MIVLITQFLVWYCLIYNSSNYLGFLSVVYFMPLAYSTLMITAAGYIINDYFDIKIDVINRPEKVTLGKKIPLRKAILAHVFLNIGGLLIAAIVAFEQHHLEWLWVQALSITLLWFYSTHFKKQFFIGNIVVALLTAMSIIVLVVYDPSLGMHYKLMYYLQPQPPIKAEWMCYGFAFFAFMLTLMREIVKDMEDFKGDAEEGCVTMPIQKGLDFSAKAVKGIGFIALLILGYFSIYFIKTGLIALGTYTLLFIILPLIAWCFYLSKKNTTLHYHSASKWLKIIMLLGISSLIIYNLSLKHIL